MQEPSRTREFARVVYCALQRWQTLAFILLIFVLIAITIVAWDSDPVLIALLAVFGLAGTAVMVYLHFRYTEMVEEALIAYVDPSQLKTERMRNAVRRAKAYQTSIQHTLGRVRSEDLKESLRLVTSQMNEPIETIFSLAQRWETYQSDQLIQDDTQRLQRKSREEELTEDEHDHLASLERLEKLMNDAAVTIDNTLAQLGSSYSEVQLVCSTKALRGDVSHVLQDLRQRSDELRDLTTSLDEVYGPKP